MSFLAALCVESLFQGGVLLLQLIHLCVGVVVGDGLLALNEPTVGREVEYDVVCVESVLGRVVHVEVTDVVEKLECVEFGRHRAD